MKIGIFGGSFDPIHVGHAIIAGAVMEQSDLQQLWLMVTPTNPWKAGNEMAADVDRLRMTEMVTRRLEGVTTSAFEMQLPRPSYTFNTLRALRERFPEHEFALVIGADNWAEWERWREHDEIVHHHHLYIYPRRGYDIIIPPSLRDRVHRIDAPLIEVSSSNIRRRISAGQSITFHVTHDVETYIIKKNLYQHTNDK